MAIRSGMVNPVAHLRELCNLAGTAEYTVNSVSYFTDEQLQAELDRTQVYFTDVPLNPVKRNIGGLYVWYDYTFPDVIDPCVEENLELYNSAGGTVSGGTVNYPARRVTFSADQFGLEIRITGCFYNIYRAAALIWKKKAGFAAKRVNVSIDGQSITAAQEYDHCMEQYRAYMRQAGSRVARFVRTDESW